jgi:hypothetical protein
MIKKTEKQEQPAEAQGSEELLPFDKKRQIKEKPKKAGGFGQRKPKEAPAAEPAGEAPAGTFFKKPKVEKPKKSGFGKR